MLQQVGDAQLGAARRRSGRRRRRRCPRAAAAARPGRPLPCGGAGALVRVGHPAADHRDLRARRPSTTGRHRPVAVVALVLPAARRRRCRPGPSCPRRSRAARRPVAGVRRVRTEHAAQRHRVEAGQVDAALSARWVCHTSYCQRPRSTVATTAATISRWTAPVGAPGRRARGRAAVGPAARRSRLRSRVRPGPSRERPGYWSDHLTSDRPVRGTLSACRCSP